MLVIFGGTTEGRLLAETCSERGIPALYCVATEDGARAAARLPSVSVRVGRLNAGEITALLRELRPSAVVDATHPYAVEASGNIRLASERSGIPLRRVLREAEEGGIVFTGTGELLRWLEETPGKVFVTTGSSQAKLFTGLRGFADRVWLRILPNAGNLAACLALGYRPDRLICMQGPFPEELNRAMFRAAGARILVTKNAGRAGGFPEKLAAANSLGMLTAVLGKPEEAGGETLEEVRRWMTEGWR